MTNTSKFHGTKGVLLGRVSTDMETQGSIPSQINIGRRVAKGFGIEVPDEYVCIGEASRSEWPRAEIVKALAIIESDPEVALLVAWEGKRAYGDAVQQRIIFDKLRQHKVRMFDGNGREINAKGISNVMMDRFDALMAEIEVLITRERVRTTHMSRFVDDAQWLLCPADGFKAIPVVDEHGMPILKKGKKVQKKIVIDDERLVVVQQIFRWAGDDHLSQYEISKRLNEAGIETPRGAKIWRNKTVGRIVRNRIYIGEMWWNRTEMDRIENKKIQLPRDAEEWVTQPSPFGVVIGTDPEDGVKLFERANASLNSRPNYRANRRYYHAFDGLVRCGRCGCAMTRLRRGQKDRNGEQVKTYYFRCAGAINTKGACEKDHQYPQIRLMKKLRHWVEHYGNDEALLAGDVAVEVALVSNGLDDREVLLKKAEDKVTQFKTALVRAREAYDAGVDSLTEFGTAKKRLTGDLQRAERDVKVLRRATPSDVPESVMLSARMALTRLLDLIEDETIPIEDRQRAARQLISVIQLDNPKVSIKLRADAEVDRFEQKPARRRQSAAA